MQELTPLTLWDIDPMTTPLKWSWNIFGSWMQYRSLILIIIIIIIIIIMITIIKKFYKPEHCRIVLSILILRSCKSFRVVGIWSSGEKAPTTAIGFVIVIQSKHKMSLFRKIQTNVCNFFLHIQTIDLWIKSSPSWQKHHSYNHIFGCCGWLQLASTQHSPSLLMAVLSHV